MLFNSIDFAIFLPIVFILYWIIGKYSLRYQNLFILAASYLFYGWWDYRFLGLIFISSLVDFIVGIKLGKATDNITRRLLLATSISVNIGFLAFFKYYNFFLCSFTDAFTFLGNSFDHSRLSIILPVGISFYTFQTLSYTIDIYRNKINPTKDVIAFFGFVSFFPQLVAGPIERASNLLPQFLNTRKFDYHKAVDGLRQILWGLFKKIVIADNCAIYVNDIFSNYTDYSGSTLLLGAVFFAFQIYGDFSGYSDIAIGTARLFGISLMQNFAFPYFSRDIAEFWRRWHISLTSWFKDYLYIPLGGSRGALSITVRNIFIVFIISGFWHGANWTFIIWGVLNALYFLPLLLAKSNRNHLEIVAQGKILPGIKDFFLILITFGLVVLAWVFFRAENIHHALNYLSGIFSVSLFTIPDFPGIKKALLIVFLTAIFVLIEWLGREEQFAIASFGLRWRRPFRYGFYYAIILAMLWFGGKSEAFIYFQF